jgi:hypothetical protein
MKEWMIERNPCSPNFHVATTVKVKLTELEKPHFVFAVEREDYDKLEAEFKEFFLDMLDQGCGIYNSEKGLMEYDHMCLSTWESATSYAVERGWIKKEQVTR